MILASPTIEYLHQAYPSAKITLILRPEILPLVELCPHIDRFVTMPRYNLFGAWRKIRFAVKSFMFCFRHRLFRNAVSYVLHTTPYAQECVLSFVACARSRVGCINPEIRWSRLCFSEPVFPRGRHEVERIMSVGQKGSSCTLPALTLRAWLCDTDYEPARENLTDGIRYIAVGCNVTQDKHRRWPVHKYAETIRRFHEEHPQYQFVVVGGQNDKEFALELISLTGSYVKDFSGRLTLRESCAVLSHCDCFIGNDSGPMHMAAAVGTPVVEISGCPTGYPVDHHNAPERFGPYGVPSVICRPKRNRSLFESERASVKSGNMLGVCVNEAFDALQQLASGLFSGDSAQVPCRHLHKSGMVS